MTVTRDSSSPAAARSSGASTVSPAFTPPAASLLVAFCQGDANNGSLDEDQTVVDSNSNTWAKKVLRNGNGGGCVTIHYFRNTGPSPGSITATLTDTKGSVAKSIFPEVFTDPATGICPDIGATAVSGSASVTLVTTVNNSWVWNAVLTANATLAAGSGCTLWDETGGFDGGDAVGTFSQTSVTPTAGTSVTNTITGTSTVPHNAAIEIIPGVADNYAGPWTGPTPGRLGPTGQWISQPLAADSITLVSLADVGSSVEALAVTATVPLADAGSSAESLAVTAAVPLADTGASAEALAVSATSALADTGTSAEALAVTVATPLADSGASAEAVTVAATSPLADTGTTVEALSVSAVSPLSESGSASDVVIAGIAISPSDTASSAEVVTVAAAVPLSETAGGTEAVTAAAAVAVADTASSVEALTVVVTKLLADSASGQDALSASPISPGVVHDTMVFPVMQAALACLQTAFLQGPNPPALYQLRPGNSFVANADNAFDECCAGIAWVRMGTMWPTDAFPIQKVDVGASEETDWAVQIELGVQRCIPTQGNDGVYGSVVTSAQWLAAVQQEEDDAASLRRAMCCLRDTYVDSNGRRLTNAGLIPGVQTPLENSGPCGGIMLVVTVRVPACDCM